jgi:hypothetical protein
MWCCPLPFVEEQMKPSRGILTVDLPHFGCSVGSPGLGVLMLVEERTDGWFGDIWRPGISDHGICSVLLIANITLLIVIVQLS